MPARNPRRNADAPPPLKVTIREVAARAGVSIMTVSRVMRNEPQVAEETRKAVQRAIQELHYVPLPSARNLSSAKARVIGLAAHHTMGDSALKSGYEHFSALHVGALHACQARGYGLMVVHVDAAMDPMQLVRLVQGRQIGGYVVAAPCTEVPGLLDTLHRHGVASSAISPCRLEDDRLWVAPEDRAAVREMTSAMVQAGHHRIGYVGGGEHKKQRAGSERFKGFMEAMKGAGLAVAPQYLATTPDPSFEQGLQAGRALLALKTPPTAIQCEADELAAGVIVAAHERQLRLPEELSICGFGDDGMARKTWPLLSTAHHPIEEMTAYAATQVIGALEGQPLENRCFNCPLQMRNSVARPSSGTQRVPSR